jgi:hypothetical protein
MAYVGNPVDTQNTFQSLVGKRFNGDGSTTDFTLDVAPSSTLDLEVFVGNVRQDPNSAYTVSGTTLSFTGAPPSGTNNVYVVHQAKSVGTIDVPTGGVQPGSLASNVISGQTLVTLDNANDHVLINDATDGALKKALIPAASFAGIDDQSSSNDDQLTITDTAVVINEDSDDVDFRVESNGNANMLFVSGGNDVVGIGAEGDLGVGLHIKSADSGASVATNADELVIEGSGVSGMSILSGNSSTGRISFGDDGDNDIGFIRYDHSANEFNFTTNAAARMFIRSNGQIDIGAGIASDSGFTLQVDNNEPNCTDFVGDMSDGGSAAHVIRRLSHDGTIILFKSASGDTGSIGVSGGTVSYNTFTGSHYCEPPSDAVPAYGELVSFTGTNKYLNDVYPPTDKWRQAEADQGKCSQSDVGNVRPLSFYGGAGTGEIIYGVEKTATANDRKVLGGYFLAQPDKPDLAAAVGNYDIWVVDKGANIAVGDWLISSDVAGHAMRDDGTTYSTAYVFAMATENVDWSTVTDTVSGTSTKKKKISVLFERFVRN